MNLSACCSSDIFATSLIYGCSLLPRNFSMFFLCFSLQLFVHRTSSSCASACCCLDECQTKVEACGGVSRLRAGIWHQRSLWHRMRSQERSLWRSTVKEELQFAMQCAENILPPHLSHSPGAAFRKDLKTPSRPETVSRFRHVETVVNDDG